MLRRSTASSLGCRACSCATWPCTGTALGPRTAAGQTERLCSNCCLFMVAAGTRCQLTWKKLLLGHSTSCLLALHVHAESDTPLCTMLEQYRGAATASSLTQALSHPQKSFQTSILLRLQVRAGCQALGCFAQPDLPAQPGAEPGTGL